MRRSRGHSRRTRSLVCVASIFLALSSPARAQQSATPSAPRDSAPAAVEGVVYDSVRGGPLAGATVQMLEPTHPSRAYSVETDSAGAFRIPNVSPGTYLIGFLDSELDELGLSSIERGLKVDAGPVVHVALSVPGALRIRTTFCGAPARADSLGMMLGFVRDADTGFPIGSAHVVAVWWEIVLDNRGLHRERREVPAKADPSGWFAICGLPADGPIDTRAELGKRITSFIEVVIPPRGLLIRDFSLGADTAVAAAHDSLGSPLGDPVRHGTARVVGVVYNPTGTPLAGAHVTVWGAGATGVSDENGRFAFQRLPSGTQTLDVQYLGLAPLRLVLDLVSGRTDTLVVRMTKPAQVLSAVHVYGKKSRVSRIDEFLHRRQQGMGHYLTAEDIAKRRPYQVTDLFYTMPGMHVVPTSNFEYGVVSSRMVRPAILPSISTANW